MSCADQLMQMKRNFNAARVEFKAVAAERDAALAENAKLREAFGVLADFVGCYRSVVEVYTLPQVADEVEADRLRELIAEMESDEVEARTVLGQYEDAARALAEAPR